MLIFSLIFRIFAYIEIFIVMKKLHEYTLEELANEFNNTTNIQPILNEEVYKAMTPEEKIKACRGITLEEFETICMNKIDEICDKYGYN